MSLLDTDEWIGNESGYDRQPLITGAYPAVLHAATNEPAVLVDTPIPAETGAGAEWLKITAHIEPSSGLWRSTLIAEIAGADSVKRTAIRLDNPVGSRTGEYAFYMRIPEGLEKGRLKLSVGSAFEFKGALTRLEVTILKRRINQ